MNERVQYTRDDVIRCRFAALGFINALRFLEDLPPLLAIQNETDETEATALLAALHIGLYVESDSWCNASMAYNRPLPADVRLFLHFVDSECYPDLEP